FLPQPQRVKSSVPLIRDFRWLLLEALDNRLGRCKRCMFACAVFLVLSWGNVFFLMRAKQSSVALIALGTMLAVIASYLVIADGLAFALRQVGGIASQKFAQPTVGNSGLVGPLPADPSARSEGRLLRWREVRSMACSITIDYISFLTGVTPQRIRVY